MLKIKKSRLLALASLSALMACGNTPSDGQKAAEQNQAQKKDEVALAATPAPATQDNVPQANPDDLDIKKVSQALGHFIGRNLKAPGINFDTESIIIGIREGSEGKPAPMSDADYEKAMTKLQQKAVGIIANTNLEAADKFMKENAAAKGVVELVPGKLQYLIIEEGKDPAVPEHGTPLINYTGKYADGTVFGSSENAGGPIAVPIDHTIPGFSKGIAGMKEGEKRRLFVHPELGYGTSGQLPPNSLLIFDIEVIKATAPEKDVAETEEVLIEEDVEGDFDDEEDEIAPKAS